MAAAQAGQRRPGADQLSDAAPPHDAVRDVRDQVPREAADLRRAAVDPPSTANINEYSARYSILDNEFYLPAPEHLAAQATSNRQGRGAVLRGRRRRGMSSICCAKTPNAPMRGYAQLLNEDAAASRSIRPAGSGARTRADELVAQFLYAVVLEDRPAQSDAFPRVARRSACAI